MKAFMLCLFIVPAFLTLLSCHPSPSRNYHYIKPVQLADGLHVDNLSDVGIDTNRIVALTRMIMDNLYPNIHSMLILRHGKLVYENYFPGQDIVNGHFVYIEHAMNDLHDCRSISKSFTSACIGIAVRQGFIKSIDGSIFPYFKEYEQYFDAEKRKITIRHLLTMTSGLDWNENLSYLDPQNTECQMDRSTDPIAFTLSRKLSSAPGSTWNYSAASAQLLANILWKASGLKLDKFAERYLFAPLGIKNYSWTPIAPDMPAAAWGLRLRSRDLAKFGLLYMNNGKWGNRQLLDSDWVRHSLNSEVSIPSAPGKPQGYGYQFWVSFMERAHYQYALANANGNGGQHIFFWRDMDILLVFTGGNYDRTDINNDAGAAFGYLVPAVKDMQRYLKP